MPPKRKPRSSYRSSLADNARPGGPTTMDVLIRWFTVPGNVKRWRMEPHSPLVREVVELMQEEGLAHRQAPFVRYKLDAIEKQYITAKQWLLETGMHDVYMRGKASKEVKVHVENVCPQFKRLDPTFRGVAFSKRNEEPIELDGDSVEDVEVLEGEKGGDQESEEEEDEESEEEEEFVDSSKKIGTSLMQSVKPPSKKAVTLTTQQKRNTFRDRLLSSTAHVGEETALSSSKSQKRSKTLEEELLSSTANAVGKERAWISAETKQQTKDRSLPSTVNVVGKEKAVMPDELKKNRAKPKEQILSAAVKIAVQQAASEAVASTQTPAPPKETRGRPSKAIAAVRSTVKEAKKTALNAKKGASLEPTVDSRKRRISVEELSTVKKAQKKRNDTKEELMVIEREALLERVEDEQKQRREVYKLERSKLECELESRQVQLLYEKASARKKLDQLGVPLEEIDRILPL